MLPDDTAANPFADTGGSSAFDTGGIAAPDTGFGNIFGGEGTASQQMADALGLGVAPSMGGDTGIPDMADTSFMQPGTVDESNPFGDMPASPTQDMAAALGANDVWNYDTGQDMAAALGANDVGNYDAGQNDSGYGSDSGFATGGGFTVPYTGKGGADTVPVRMNLSGGEQVSIGQGGGAPDHRVGGYGAAKTGGGDIHMHFHGVQDMGSFMAPQSRMAMQRWARGAMQ
jgi:hypothetical protein